ncbi:hypothetical protein [Streptomyces sp. NPDC088801]|uniref:SCO2400 family protein n=1 Tax=Streptomyces sp. NPDC088801 TaxID=3365903 RepID=UPI0037FC953E
MDFCDPCRRHLNGALACPGCGTSAETLRRSREPEYGRYGGTASGPAAETPTGPGRPDASAGGYGDAYGDGPYEGTRSDDDPYDASRGEPDGDDPDDATRSGDDGDDDGDGERQGRAARRRGRGRGPVAEGPGGASRRDRKAAAHRRRRRRTLLVAAGFVLAAGGLSLAELGMDAPRSTPKPAAAGGESPDGDAPVEAGKPGGGPGGKGAGAEGSSGSPSPEASDSPSPSGSRDDEESNPPEGDEASKDPESATEGGAPSRPASAPTAAPPAPEPAPTSDPTTQAPRPEPSAPEPCKRFLWWCA